MSGYYPDSYVSYRRLGEGMKCLFEMTLLRPMTGCLSGDGCYFGRVATRPAGQIVVIVMVLHMMRPEYIYGEV